MNISQSLNNVLNSMPESWMPLLIGGCVRDYILGKDYKDIDIEVHNTDIDTLLTFLKDFGSCDIVGKAFGVIKFTLDGETYDFSVPRRENKVGNGHRDFTISLEDVSFEEAFLRRDLTINAIAFNPKTNQFVDPFNGLNDLKNGIIRATSPAFQEDALRVLRIFQFVSRFGFDVDSNTIQMCKNLKNEFKSLPTERIYEEWQKFVLKGIYAVKAMQFLIDCEWIEFWPELNNMIGVQQSPIHHPEGWSFSRISLDSFRTSVTQSLPADYLPGNIFSISQTTDAMRESFSGTFSTKSVSSMFSFATTGDTFNNSFFFSSVFKPTVITKPQSLMVDAGATTNTNKVFRIMFEVSESSMKRIMDVSINDFEVFKTIVSFVTVNMMNVLVSGESVPKFNLHDVSMEPNTTFSPREINPSINITSGVIIFPQSDSVNRNVFFSVEFAVDNNIFTHIEYSTENELYFNIKIGDTFDHSSYVIQSAMEIAVRESLDEFDRSVLVYSAITHDMGKPSTTKLREVRGEMKWTAYGHEKEGVPFAENFLNSIGVPKKVINHVLPHVEWHMQPHTFAKECSDKTIRKLAERLLPSNINMLAMVSEADGSGRPPLPKEKGLGVETMLEKANKLNCLFAPQKPLITGKMLIEAGVPQGVKMGNMLKDAWQKQLDGTLDVEKFMSKVS
jgi:hypothetical protein